MKRFHHLRSKNHHGGLTLVSNYNEVTHSTTVHYAICSLDDQYCRKLGITQAESNPNTVELNGYVHTDSQLTSLFLAKLPPSERHLAIKSILHSMTGRKLTKGMATNLRTIYQQGQISHTVAWFLDHTHSIGNRASLKEITLLFDTLRQL